MVNYAIKYMEYMHYACRNGFLPELRYMYEYERRFSWKSAKPIRNLIILAPEPSA